MSIPSDEPTVRPRRLLPSGLTGLAGLAGAACCAIPLLLAAGVLGGGTIVLLGQLMPGIALGLAVLAGLAWWRAARRTAHRHGCGAGCPDQAAPDSGPGSHR